MMAVMETLLLSYFIAIGLLTVTPGVDTALIIRTAALEGKQQAWFAMLGINFGCLIWGFVIAIGFGTLLLASQSIFNILKWGGAIYLTWLGLQLIFSKVSTAQFSVEAKKSAAMSSKLSQPNWFLRGFLGNILNPKIGIFYIAFLPQFIPSHEHVFLWTLGLVFIHILLGLAWCSVLIFGVNRLRPYLLNETVLKWMNRVTGGIFLLFAFKLIQSRN